VLGDKAGKFEKSTRMVFFEGGDIMEKKVGGHKPTYYLILVPTVLQH
jgi:hypothetical protein